MPNNRTELISKRTKQFIFYANVTIIPFGLLFNTLAIFIFSRPNFKSHRFAFYSRLNLFIHNCIHLVLLVYFCYLLFDVEVILLSDWLCKLKPYVVRVLFQFASWVELLITFDRLHCIRMGSNLRLNNQSKLNILKLLILIFTIILIINTPNFGFYLMDAPLNNQTASKYGLRKYCSTQNNYVFLSRDIISQLMRVYLPFILSVTMNVMLIRVLIKSKKKAQISRNMKKEYNFGLTIFALNTLFLITHIPLGITMGIATLRKYYSPLKFMEEWDGIYFSSMVTLYIVSFYYSLAFWINLKFNELFFKEFMLIIKQFKLRFNLVSTNTLSETYHVERPYLTD